MAANFLERAFSAVQVIGPVSLRGLRPFLVGITLLGVHRRGQTREKVRRIFPLLLIIVGVILMVLWLSRWLHLL
jgi:hypothetical protein